MAELKPCPFCGGEAAFLIWKDDHWVWMAADKCKPYVQPWAGTTVDNFQSIDAVPVVRCKGCKYYRNHPNGLCYLHTEPTENERGYSGEAVCVEPDDFCSYGERNEGAANG